MKHFKVHCSFSWRGADGTGSGTKNAPQFVDADTPDNAQVEALRGLMDMTRRGGEPEIIVGAFQVSRVEEVTE
jgi:hypothetical protein